MCKANATPGLPLKQVKRGDIGILTKKLNGVTILGMEGEATAIRNKGSLPTDWHNVLNLNAMTKGGSATMKHAHNIGGKLKLITFTIKIRCPKGDVAEELDSVSIDLTHDNPHFRLKSIMWAREDDRR